MVSRFSEIGGGHYGNRAVHEDTLGVQTGFLVGTFSQGSRVVKHLGQSLAGPMLRAKLLGEPADNLTRERCVGELPGDVEAENDT
jgi:hypothetical protein